LSYASTGSVPAGRRLLAGGNVARSGRRRVWKVTPKLSGLGPRACTLHVIPGAASPPKRLFGYKKRQAVFLHKNMQKIL